MSSAPPFAERAWPTLPLPFAQHSPTPSATALPAATAAADASAHWHLVLPYAALQDPSCQHVLGQLQAPNALPQLQRVLRSLQAAPARASDDGDEDTPIPPHERAVARAWGLNPQAPAWAAAADNAPANDTPCGWFHPCHWTAGADQVRMDDPSALPLSAEDAQALHAIIAPWFAEDGLQLHIDTPARWRISGAPLAQLPTSAALDRVLLRDVRAWQPSSRHARQLHRLQSEVQMLLYTHPFNDARAQRHQPPINAFWIEGTGSLDDAARSTLRQRQSTHPVTVVDSLRQTALRQDWPAWKRAWQAADAGPIAQLAQHIAQGGSATLVLCGERNARSFTTAPRNWLGRLQQLWGGTSFKDIHPAL